MPLKMLYVYRTKMDRARDIKKERVKERERQTERERERFVGVDSFVSSSL